MDLEQALNEIINLKETIKDNEMTIADLNTQLEQSKTLIETKDNTISDLKDYNMQLFKKVDQSFNTNFSNDYDTDDKQDEEKGPVPWEDFRLEF